MTIMLQVTRTARAALQKASAPGCSRMFSTLDEKERGDERRWISQQEEMVLKNLLESAKKREAEAAQKGAAKDAELEKLKGLVGKDVSQKDLEALIKWKYET